MSSFTLDGVAENDLKRFAACFLVSDIGNTNWEAAMKLYDPNTTSKVQSFRTVTGRAIQKVTGEKATKSGGGSAENGDAAEKPAKKPAAGGKRKKAASEENEDGETEQPKPKKGRAAPKGKGKKKAASEERVVEDEEEPAVKGEAEGEESS